MKKLTILIQCISFKIKKFFLNRDTANSIDCNNLPLFNQWIEQNEKKELDEYIENYTTTTRWQTV